MRSIIICRHLYANGLLPIKRNECKLMRLLWNEITVRVSSSSVHFFHRRKYLLHIRDVSSYICSPPRIDSTVSWMWQMSVCILNSIFIECQRCVANAASNDLHNFRAGPPFRYLYAPIISCRIFAMPWLVIKITLRAGNTGKRQDWLVNRPYGRT